MNMRIRLDDTEVTKKLNDLTSGLKDFSVPFREAGDDILDYVKKEVFPSQGIALGDKWKPLAPSTLFARAHRQGHYAKSPVETNKILIWTGKLREGFFKTVARKRLEIDNSVEYYDYHQKASGMPPQRRMLAVNSRIITMVMERINNFALKLIRK